MTRHCRRQGGAVLMIAMILIFILSILGAAAMRGASLEGQLASNSVHKEITFQAAESASDSVFSTDGKLESMICNDEPETLIQNALGQSENQLTSSVLEYGGQTLALGNSINGAISYRRFVVTGTSSLPGVNTSTTIVQGMILTGAAGSNGGTGDC